MSHAHMVKILLVEDNPADIELTREAFEENSLVNDLHVIEDGAEALDYLFRRDEHKDAELPDIILLDINLPKVSGLDILKQVKEDENLKNIPVIMLTASADDMDIFKSYQRYCSGYITKPVNITNFVEVAKTIEGYWFGLVTFSQPNKGISFVQQAPQ